MTRPRAPHPVSTLGRMISRIRPRALVLAYHRIADVIDDPFGQTVSPYRFERQLQLLRTHFDVVSLPTLLELLSSRRLRHGTVAVTFDDGYGDALTTAHPVAFRLEIPITIFVTAEPIFSGTRFWWDELAASVLTPDPPSPSLTLELAEGERLFRMATSDERWSAFRQLHALLKRTPARVRRDAVDSVARWAGSEACALQPGEPLSVEQLRRLADSPGVTIGSHTLTHPSLASLPPAEQEHELNRGKQLLEGVVDQTIDLLAYPFGKHDDVSSETHALAAHAGFRAAFMSVPFAVTASAPVLALPRLTAHELNDDAFLAQLHAVLR